MEMDVGRSVWDLKSVPVTARPPLPTSLKGSGLLKSLIPRGHLCGGACKKGRSPSRLGEGKGDVNGSGCWASLSCFPGAAGGRYTGPGRNWAERGWSLQ